MTTPKTRPASPPPAGPDDPPGAVTPFAPRSHTAALVALDGASWGHRCDVGFEAITIGVEPDDDIVISQWQESSTPTRATARRSEQGVRLQAAETAVLLVQDEQVSVAELADGGEFIVGRTRFRCLVGPNVERDYHQTLFELSTRDPLTGSVSRRAVLESLEREMGRARRYGEPLAIGLFDLDHFKRVNDTHGQRFGDHALRTVAGVGATWALAGDVLGRFGGEEFLVILPTHDVHAATERLESLRRAIEATEISRGGRQAAVTASFGLACLHNGDTVRDLLERADQRVAEAKALGRNRLIGP